MPKRIRSIACLLVLATTCSSCSFMYRAEFKKGEEAIARIENFRKEKGRLPESLAEVGIKADESGPIYYQKESDTKYAIWFTIGPGPGNSMVYESDTKKWKRSS